LIVLSRPIPVGSKWLKFNVGQYGYYRVNYPLEDWESLSNVLQDNAQALSVSDRASLINDAFALAQGGRLPFSMALQMTQYLVTRKKIV
jgi:glutamyl aminopeptidase